MPDRDILMMRLAAYVRCLEQGAASTTRAEDRNQYRDRLAEAARVFAAIAGPEPEWSKVSEIVSDEARAIGWSFLPGSNGEEAEEMFDGIRKYVAGS